MQLLWAEHLSVVNAYPCVTLNLVSLNYNRTLIELFRIFDNRGTEVSLETEILFFQLQILLHWFMVVYIVIVVLIRL